jgi:hypothetical protein
MRRAVSYLAVASSAACASVVGLDGLVFEEAEAPAEGGAGGEHSTSARAGSPEPSADAGQAASSDGGRANGASEPACLSEGSYWQQIGMTFYPWLATSLIPVVFADSTVDGEELTASEATQVRLAFAEWSTATSGQVQFVEQDEPMGIYLRVSRCVQSADGDAQVDFRNVTHGWGSLRFCGAITKQTVVHALGHVLGLPNHEQRADRDEYLSIYPERIRVADTNCASLAEESTYSPVFTKVPLEESLGSFDYRSVMLDSSVLRLQADPAFTTLDGDVIVGWQDGDGRPSYDDGSAALETSRQPFGWSALVPSDTALNSGQSDPVDLVGAPAVCFAGATSSTRSVVFARGTNGQIWRREGSDDWVSISGSLVDSDPACARTISGALLVAAVGKDGKLVIWRDADGSDGVVENVLPPEQIALSAPAVTAVEGKTIVYAIGTDGNLWQLYSGSDGAWSDWSTPRVGPRLTGAPSAAVVNYRSPSVVARAVDDSVLRLDWDDAGNPGNWEEAGTKGLSGTGRVSMLSWRDGRIDLFVVGGLDRFIWQSSFWPTGEKQEWVALGGILASSPAAAVSPDEAEVIVVGVGRDQHVWEKHWRR